jgi:hypothetical protein
MGNKWATAVNWERLGKGENQNENIEWCLGGV